MRLATNTTQPSVETGYPKTTFGPSFSSISSAPGLHRLGEQKAARISSSGAGFQVFFEVSVIRLG
jgi:hypothetical protein